MLVLTDEIGQQVFDASGRCIGRVVELIVDASDPDARVRRVGIGRDRFTRGRSPVSWVGWSGIEAFETSAVQLRASAAVTAVDDVSSMHNASNGELWLVRDVLDTQILDPHGGRLVRVGDVALARVEGDLVVAALEFGTGPVARRLGLRRLGERLQTSSIPWRDLHLVSGRGLTAQLATSSDRFESMSASQLAMMVAQIPARRASEVLDAVGARQAAGVLGLTHPDVSERLVDELPDRFVSEMLVHMPSDDAVGTLRRQSEHGVNQLLRHVEPSRAVELRSLLAHPPDTAGGLMSSDLHVAAVGDSVEAIRSRLVDQPPRSGRFGGVIVVDDDGRPVGLVNALDLIIGSRAPVVTEFGPVSTRASVAEVIDLFATHDIEAAAVVDDDGRLVGCILIDDVLEELVAERRPGRRRFAHVVGRHRSVPGRPRAEVTRP